MRLMSARRIRTGKRNVNIGIRLLLGYIRMKCGHMMEKTRTLKKFLVVADCTFKRKILVVNLLNVIMHSVLPVFDFITVRTYELTLLVTNILFIRSGHDCL